MDKTIHQNTRILALLKGLLIAYAITAVILLLLSFLMLKLSLPAIVISGGINFAYIASTFMGGFLVGKRVDQKKFVWGLILGICYFILVLLVCIAMNAASPLPFGSMLTVLVICGLSGMLGGMLS